MTTPPAADAVAAARVCAIAARLLDPEAVTSATSGPDAASLAHGLSGTALLHARLALVDPAFATAAARHWSAAATHARRHGPAHPGIFTTGGGLAASLIIGTGYLPDPGPWQNPLIQATRWLSHQAQRIADDLHQRRSAGDPFTPWAAYDVISGLGGICRVLLAATMNARTAAEAGLLAALRALTAMILTPHGSRPGWWLPAALHPRPVPVDPSGSAATGMAHGIAGPLAALGIAHVRGWTVAGQTDAIRLASQWLLDWTAEDGNRWPASITGEELDAGFAALSGRQDAWCYGTPGISVALTHAALALDDAALANVADAALASLATRPTDAWDTDGATLCHGNAGVAQSAFQREPAVAAAAVRAVDAAIAPDRPFMIPHTDRGTVSDHPGLLTGAAGGALALADHAAVSATPVTDRWDCVLLLS